MLDLGVFGDYIIYKQDGSCLFGSDWPMWSPGEDLTFVTNAEADVRVALVSGEEEIQEVGGADEELGNLGALVTSN